MKIELFIFELLSGGRFGFPPSDCLLGFWEQKPEFDKKAMSNIPIIVMKV